MNTNSRINCPPLRSLVLALVCAAPAFAQGQFLPNDECATAEPIAGEGIFSFNNMRPYELLPGELDCDFVNDVWYCWTAPCDGPATFDTCGTTAVDTLVEVYAGCDCPAVNLLETDCGGWGDDPLGTYWPYCGYQSRITFTAQQGENYLIRLGTSSRVGPDAGGGTGLFTLDCSMPVEPPCACPDPSEPCPLGDEQTQSPDTFDAAVSTRGVATGSALLTPGADGEVTDVCFWGLYLDDEGDCSFGATDAFEIRYYADNDGVPGTLLAELIEASGTLTVTERARTDRFVADRAHEYEYSATHAPLAVTAGTCYWIEITNGANGNCRWHWSVTTDDRGRAVLDGDGVNPPNGYDARDAVAQRLAFRTNLALDDTRDCAAPPANDDCAAAALIADGAFDIETRGATTDGPEGQGACDPPGQWCCNFPLGDETINQDVWYDYVAPCTGTLTVDVDASTYDPKVAVYNGAACPPADYAIACNDDLRGTPGPLNARAAVAVTQGQLLKLRVGGFRDSQGSAVMNVDCGPPPLSDACADATVRQLPDSFTGSNIHATSDCAQIPGTHTWIAFELTQAGAVTLDYSGSPSPFAYASPYLATDCSCQSLIPADRQDRADDGNPTVAWNCLAAGTYYYSVAAEPGSEGSYQITATTGPCTTACDTGQGDCYADNGTPGCDDPDCCSAVCDLDEYCCTANWDGLCAQAAAVMCNSFPEAACANATGDCYEPHEGPGCNDPAVCERVCNCDPYCCILDWDGACAGSGFLPGPGCGGATDCNGNGWPDADEILNPQLPASADCNDNSLPDECDAIADGDFDADRDVDLDDYAYFIDCLSGPNRRPLPANFMCVGACLHAFDAVENPRPQTVDLADLAVLQNRFGAPTP